MSYCLMLRIIALRWWPEIKVSDDYNFYEYVSYLLTRTNLEQKLLDEQLYLDACWKIFSDEYDIWFPPHTMPKSTPGINIIRIIPPAVLEIPIAELELSMRSARALKHLQIKTAGELIAYSPKELMKIKNCGRRSVREIQGVLKDIGLYLRKNTEE